MISIIITAYKEPKTIAQAIKSIITNRLEDCEIIVAAPDQETLNEASKFSQVKTLKDPGKGKPIALNLAISKAKGDILVLTDGDVFVSKNSIKQLLTQFSDPKIGAVTGCPVSLNNKDSMYGFWSHFLTDIAHKRRLKASRLGKKFFCSGYLYALRKKLLKPIPEGCVVEDGFFSHLIWQQGYSKESSGLWDLFRYSKSLKQEFWALGLIVFRVYLWLAIAYKFKFKKEKSSQNLWTRIESTK
ncbi:MAG: glycosyltransferase family 2 protein [Candidatus Pacearchaeota archaeon]|nr:glycosyltransferase family 2 protein [Candidatus Pacearchaeota archaeon]